MSDVKTLSKHTVFEAFEVGKSSFISGMTISTDSDIYHESHLKKAFREGWRFQEKQNKPYPSLKVEPNFSDLKK